MWLVGVVSMRQVWLVVGIYGYDYQEVGVVRMYAGNAPLVRMYKCG